MGFDIESIEKIIVHKLIYSSDKKKFETDCSDRLISNLLDITPKIKGKIEQLLSKKIIMDIRTGSKIFDMAQKVPQMKDEEFIAASIKAAKKLAGDQQSSKTKKYVLLIVMHAKNIKGEDIVFFVKSELDDGFKTEPDSLTVLNNVIFTNTNYYRIGAFLCKKGDEWESVLYDNSATKGAKKKAGKYFYNTFLELSFITDNDDWVKIFDNEIEKFIGEHYSDIDWFNKMNELFSYLKSTDDSNVNMGEFCKNHLSEKTEEYKDLIEEINFPEGDISKDPEMIETYLKHRIIHFQNSININIPSDKWKEDVILLTPNDIKPEILNELNELNEEGWTFIAIKGPITHKK